MHYQFEAFHPFLHGNGRTGRILNILYLVMRGMLDIPVLYLSRYIIENKAAYYQGLRNVTEQNAWEPWILYMLDAVEQTARATSEKILAIRALMREYVAAAQEKLPKIYSKDLIEVLFSQPYCRIRFLEQANIAKRQAGSNCRRFPNWSTYLGYMSILATCGTNTLQKVDLDDISRVGLNLMQSQNPGHG